MNTIDRKALVQRHNPVIRNIDPLSPLAVGNGEFAFTADFTGLQSFPERYTVPLGTQSQWGWHSTGGPDTYRLDDLRMLPLDTYGRKVGYPIDEKGQEEAFHWLRKNPHRLQLGQIGLRLFGEDGAPVGAERIDGIEQTLDLWSGMLVSRYRVDGVPVRVETCCHPERDLLAVRIESPLLQQNRLSVEIRFPAADPQDNAWNKSIALRWDGEETHRTEFTPLSDAGALFARTLDRDRYAVRVAWSNGEMVREGAHRFALRPYLTQQLEFVAEFSPDDFPDEPVRFAETARESAAHWERFWTEGGAIELAESRDPRAMELERRIVLSQFLTAIHCAGSLPPQETGLVYNSWFGKFHLEMHWWHAAHFPLWGRTHLLKKSMGWYGKILPIARELAASQGYEGARWPKMVGPDGKQSPSPIGNLLIWQQPHPIVFAELCYRAEPTRQTLEAYRDIVMETARFMASFAEWDEANGRYVLGPPVIPAQEEFKGPATRNPTFELEYWRHGLDIALRWRERLGLPAEAKWERVRDLLSDLPSADGVYLAHELCPETFAEYNTDHPSMLGAMGVLPGLKADPQVMRNTLKRVIEEWQWPTAWGWDFPMAAMTAARLNEPGWAVDLLLMDTTKNTYLANGHNYQRPGLYAYLPGNGGLLAATAMMACGWQGGPDRHAPGFPSDGTWTVRWEVLHPWL